MLDEDYATKRRRYEEEENKREFLFKIFLTVVILAGLLLVVLAWTAKATEYSMIEPADIEYCNTFSRRSAVDMVGMNEAYGDCIRILPTRLPMPAELGSVPAAEKPEREGWSQACEREYRTWDAATGTVVRRGSPERVECPLVEVDGEWVVPPP